MVPSKPIVTAGSLLPLANNSGVFENAIEALAPIGPAALTVELSMLKAAAITNNAMRPYRIRRPPPGWCGEGR